jgi:hypothetical protein
MQTTQREGNSAIFAPLRFPMSHAPSGPSRVTDAPRALAIDEQSYGAEKRGRWAWTVDVGCAAAGHGAGGIR